MNVIVPPTTNNNMYANDDDDDRCSVGGGGGGDSESSQYMRDILQVEEQSRCNQLKNKVAQNNIGRWGSQAKMVERKPRTENVN